MKTVTNSSGTTFVVRVIQQGDAYGLDDCLTHDGEQPLVEFWDLSARDRFPAGAFGITERGQFTGARYSVAELLKGYSPDAAPPCCFQFELRLGCKRWWLDGVSFHEAQQYAQQETQS